MMSRDGARTAQPARPEEPPHRLSGEGQRGPRHRAPRTTGGQDRSAGTRIRQRGRPSFTRPKSRAIAAGRVTSSRRMQSTIASRCVIGSCAVRRTPRRSQRRARLQAVGRRRAVLAASLRQPGWLSVAASRSTMRASPCQTASQSSPAATDGGILLAAVDRPGG
jgi:hypothetical protein